MNTKSGSPAQKFLARHKEFLRHWADGLHALEIAQRMGLSPAQLAKHSLKAFEEKAPRKLLGTTAFSGTNYLKRSGTLCPMESQESL